MYSFIDNVENELDNVRYMITVAKAGIDKKLRGSISMKRCKSNIYYLNKVKVGDKYRCRYLGTPTSLAVIKFKANRFNKERLKILEYDRNLLEALITDYRDYSPDAIHSKLPESYKDLPSLCYEDDRMEKMKAWAKEKYEKNQHPMKKSATTACDGTQVRSKGECIWYDSLKGADIPFRYDSMISLRDANGYVKKKSPDFEIICRTGRLLYVEHAGMLLKPDYLEDFKEKVRLYMLNGIVIGDNLIITSDNADGGTNSQMINEIINKIIKPLVFG